MKYPSSPFDIARRIFLRMSFLQMKAVEHASLAEQAMDIEKANKAIHAAEQLEKEALDYYEAMKQLETEKKPDLRDQDIAIDMDLRWVFPDIYAAEEEDGYGDWRGI